MEKSSARMFAFIGAALGWFAIITQLYIMMENRVVSIPESLLRFFGYFTIDTNIACATSFTFIALQGNSQLGKFFRRTTTITAITVYIIIVGVVYNIILRSIWDPQGMQKIVDELLHSVIPAYFALFWVFFVPAGRLKWKNAFPWLIYPFIYMSYCLVLGAITKFYPYPFVDVTQLGYNKALINAGLVLLIILALSFILISIGRLIKRS